MHRPKPLSDQASGPTNSSTGKVLYSTSTLQHNTGPNLHPTRFRRRLIQAEAGRRRRGRRKAEEGRKEETKEKTETQPGGEEKPTCLKTNIIIFVVYFLSASRSVLCL